MRCVRIKLTGTDMVLGHYHGGDLGDNGVHLPSDKHETSAKHGSTLDV